MKQKQKDYSTEIERLEDKINHLGIWNFVYSLVLIVLIITVAIISNNVYFVLSTMPQRVCTNETQEFIIEKGEWFDFGQFSNYTHYSCLFNHTLIKCTLETCIIKWASLQNV